MCDHWFASAPTETLPNRAIFGLLSAHGLNWAIYGYTSEPLTKSDFTDITGASASHFGVFTDFQAAAAAGTLPPYTFLEPSWGSSGNTTPKQG